MSRWCRSTSYRVLAITIMLAQLLVPFPGEAVSSAALQGLSASGSDDAYQSYLNDRVSNGTFSTWGSFRESPSAQRTFSSSANAVFSNSLFAKDASATGPQRTLASAGPAPPVATNDSFATNEDTPLTVVAPGVLGNDTDPDGGPLTASLVTGPSSGSLALTPAGSFVYTPTLNYSGNMSFSYRAYDGGLYSNVATATIIVTAVNDLPLAAGDTYSTNEDTALVVPAPGVLLNDVDVEGSALTALLVNGATRGTLNLSANGSFAYSPTLNFTGSDTFSYRTYDGTGYSNVATSTITISSVNDAPGIVSDVRGMRLRGDWNSPDWVDVPSLSELSGDFTIEAWVYVNQHQPWSRVLDFGNGPFADNILLAFKGDTGSPSLHVVNGGATEVTAPPIATGQWAHLAAVNDGAGNGYIYVNGALAASAAGQNAAASVTRTRNFIGKSNWSSDAYFNGMMRDIRVWDVARSQGQIQGNMNATLTGSETGLVLYYPADEMAGSVLSDRAGQTQNGTIHGPGWAAVPSSLGTNEDTPLTLSGIRTVDVDAASGGVTLSLQATWGKITLTTTISGGVSAGEVTGNGTSAVSVGSTVTRLNTTLAAGGVVYKPNANYYGVDSLALTLSDNGNIGVGGQLSASTSITLTIYPVDDPPVAYNGIWATLEETVLTVPAPGVLENDVDEEAIPVTAALVTGPAHGSVTLNADGSFVYTPTLNYNGLDVFYYSVYDGWSYSNVITAYIPITPVNDAPGIVSEVTALRLRGEAGNLDWVDVPAISGLGGDFTVEAWVNVNQHQDWSRILDFGNGAPGDNILLAFDGSTGSPTLHIVNGGATWVTAPPIPTGQWVHLAGVNDGAGNSYIYVDGVLAASASGQNVAPSVTRVSNYLGRSNWPWDAYFNGMMRDVRVWNVARSAAEIQGSMNGTLTGSESGLLLYYKADEGMGSVLFDWAGEAQNGTINGSGWPAMPGLLSTTEEAAVTVAGLRMVDVDAGGGSVTMSLQAISGTLVISTGISGGLTSGEVTANGSGTVSATGTLTKVNTTLAAGGVVYHPNANFSGSDSLIVSLDDGGNTGVGGPMSATWMISLAVSPVNDAPVAASDIYTAYQDIQLDVPVPGVLSNDADVDGNPLTAVLASGPGYGILGLMANGSFVYTPTLGYSGTDSFTYMAYDGIAYSNLATATITVLAGAGPPVAVNDSYGVTEDNVLLVAAPGVLENDSAPSGDPLSASLSSGPTNGTIALSPNGSFVYTPTLNFAGSDSIIYRAFDGVVYSSLTTATITISQVNDAPGIVSEVRALRFRGEEGNLDWVDVPAISGLGGDFTVEAWVKVNQHQLWSRVFDFGNGAPGDNILLNFHGDGSPSLHVVNEVPTEVNGPPIPTGVWVHLAGVNDGAGNGYIYVNGVLAGFATGQNVAASVTRVSNFLGRSNWAWDAYFNGWMREVRVWDVARSESQIQASMNAALMGSEPGLVLYYRANEGLGGSLYDSAAPWQDGTIQGALWVTTGVTITAPASYVTLEDTALVLSGMALSDSDAGSGNVTVSFQVSNGVLNVATGIGGGVEVGDVTGNGTADVNVTSTLARINTTLGSNGLTYLPPTNYSGSDNLVLSLNDNGNSGLGGPLSATWGISLTTRPVDDPPVGNDDSYSTNEDSTLALPAPGVLSNDTDAEANSLTVALLIGPSNGVLALSADGSFVYTPTLNYNGTDSFTYRAHDGTSYSSIATATITITAVNDGPEIVSRVRALRFGGVWDNPDWVDVAPLSGLGGDFTLEAWVNVNQHQYWSRIIDFGNGFPGDNVLLGFKDVWGSPTFHIVTGAPTEVTAPPIPTGEWVHLAGVNDGAGNSYIYANGVLAASASGQNVAASVTRATNFLGKSNWPWDEYFNGMMREVRIWDVARSEAEIQGTMYGTLTGSEPGLLVYYMVNEGAGVVLNDSAGSAENGAINGGVWVTTPFETTAPSSYTTSEDTAVALSGMGISDLDAGVGTLTASFQSSNGVISVDTGIGGGVEAGEVTGNGSADVSMTSSLERINSTLAWNGLTFLPETNYFGLASLLVTANDNGNSGLGGPLSATWTITITIDAVNDAPVAYDDSYGTSTSTPLTVSAPGVLSNDADVDGNPLTAELVTGPSNGSLTLNVDGSFVYTPTLGYTGSDSFSYRAYDGVDYSNVATATISVGVGNEAPVATGDVYSTNEDTPLSKSAAQGVLSNDTDGNGDALTASLMSGPANGVLTLSVDGSFVYTSTVNYNGTDSFTYRAFDGVLYSNVATATIIVNAADDAPVAADDSYPASEDMQLAVAAPGVLSNDSDVEGNVLAAVLISGPSHGNLTLIANGSFWYTPTLNYYGSDSFTYRAYDGLLYSNLATVTIAVNPVNDTPVANGDSYLTDENATLTVSNPGVLGNDTDAEGSPLTAVLVTGTSNGALTLGADGSFVFTPTLNYLGSDSFTYRAYDGEAYSAIATATITISSVNDAPGIVSDVRALRLGGDWVNPDWVSVPAIAGPGGDFTVEAWVNVNQHQNWSRILDFGNGPFGDNILFAFDGTSGSPTLHIVSGGATSVTAPPIATGEWVHLAGVNDGAGNSRIYVNGVEAASASGQNLAASVTRASNYLGKSNWGSDEYFNGMMREIRVWDVARSEGEIQGGMSGSLTGLESGLLLYYRADEGMGSVLFDRAGQPQNGAINGSGWPVVVSSLGTSEDTALGVSGIRLVDVDAGSGSVTLSLQAISGTLVISTGISGGLTAGEVSGSGSGSVSATSTLTKVNTTLAAGGVVYQPNANYSGLDTLSVSVDDNGHSGSGGPMSATMTISVTVSAVNDAPVANGDGYSTSENVALVVSASGVLSNDTDVEGNSLTAVVVSGPGNGSLTLNADGSLVYTPTLSFNGTDSFTYRAYDGLAYSDVATVTIGVGAVNDAPVAVDDSYTTDEDVVLVAAAPGVLSNDSDPEGDLLVVEMVSGPGHGSVALSANGSFVYTPTLNYNGLDSFTYRAYDGLAYSGVATVTITISSVNDVPLAYDDAYSVDEDTQLTVLAPGVLGNDIDVEGNALSAVLVSGASSGTLTLDSDGSFSYLANANFNGMDSFTYRSYDGVAYSNIATATITVSSVNDAPVAYGDLYSVDEDTQLTVSAPGVLGNDSDVEGSVLSAVLISGPAAGILALSADGSFIYTPTLNFNGTDTFTYRADDGLLYSSPATVTITVDAVNDAPVANSESYSTDENVPLTVASPGVLGNDTDVEGSLLTALLVGGPGNGTLTLSADGSFVYTPTLNYNGTDSFTYRAYDGVAYSGVATATITVDGVNSAPVAFDDSYATDEDTTLVVALPGVLGSDTDPDGDGLSAVLDSLPAHGAVTLNGDGSFTYVPQSNFNGTDSFSYRAYDGALYSNVATATVVVGAVNDPPVAANDSYSTGEDSSLVVPLPGVLGNDSDVEGSALSAVLITGPAGGILALSGDGSFVYTPTLNFNGTDSFTYRAYDGALYSNVATATITISSVNDAPVAYGDVYGVDEDGTLTVVTPGLLGNDVDVEGMVLAAELLGGPSHGSLTLNPDGSFTYSPVANHNGVDSFTYRAYDGVAYSNIATATITISSANDAPVAYDDAYAVDEDTQLTVLLPGVLGNDIDVESNALTAVLVTGASNGTLTLNADGSFSYLPSLNFNGTDIFTYRAYDGLLYSNLATVTISVYAVNDAPTASAESYGTDEDVALAVAIPGVLGNDTDVEGGALTALLASGPSHGTLTLAANGSFAYTPTLNYNGSDSFTYRAYDGLAHSGVATVTITINPVNDPPSATNDSYSTQGAGSLNVPAPGVLGNDTDLDGPTLAALPVSWPSNGTLTLNADGSFTYLPNTYSSYSDTFTYRANDGYLSSDIVTVTIWVTVGNESPVVNAGSDASIAEGGTFSGYGSFADADPNTWTATVDYGDGSGEQSLALDTDKTFSLSHVYADNGAYTVTVTVSDDQGAEGSDTALVLVNNVNPVLWPIVAPGVAVLVNTQLSVTASFSDVGVLDTHSAVWDWGDGSYSAGTVIGSGGSGSVYGAHSYSSAGIYTVTLALLDDDGGTAERTYRSAIVYDPLAGSINGGYWIESPQGAFVENPVHTGRANFGLNAKYQKGDVLPTGQVEFQLQGTTLNFHSGDFDWLVVSGPNAWLKGYGTINGEGQYEFLVAVVDGQLIGRGGIDKVRVRIWNKNTMALVYDNQGSAPDHAVATQSIGGGNIQIQGASKQTTNYEPFTVFLPTITVGP